MWIALSDGFISAVQHKTDPEMLVVRARNPDHLRAIFPGRRVHVSPRSDYAARVFMRREHLAEFLSNQALFEIDYPNFKDSVEDERLHRMYHEMWDAGFAYQRERELERAALEAETTGRPRRGPSEEPRKRAPKKARRRLTRGR
jgi:hypothetical protein